MAFAASSLQAKTPVEQINDALRGSVIDVLRFFIPTLAPYTNEEAFNVILNSPEMTMRSFCVFREHTDAFSHVLRGPDDRLVLNDNEPLSCGRTLTQVVALVVQAVAKRYFRKKLGPRRDQPTAPHAAAAETGLVDKMMQVFKAAPPPKQVRKTPNPGDRLFQAMRDNLLFEWQLKLIPHYVGLPLPLVQALGARILEFKEIEEIQQMVRTGQPPKPKEPQAAAPRHSEMAPPPLSASAAKPIPQSLPEGVSPQKYVAAVLGRVNPQLARRLAHDLGLNPRQLAQLLIRAYEALPANEFQRFGASAPESHEANRFIAAALTSRFPQDPSPTVTAEFARLYVANVRSAI